MNAQELKVALKSMAKHLQDDDLKVLRGRTHEVFDVLWKDEYMTRSEAYRWLRKELGLAKAECHIALFDREECYLTINLVNDYFYSDFDCVWGDQF